MVRQLEEKSGTITHRLTAETVVADPYMISKLGVARLSSGVTTSSFPDPTGQEGQVTLGREYGVLI